ncbi:hypothetical protein ACFSAA_15260 [Sphingomonas qilianensis]
MAGSAFLSFLRAAIGYGGFMLQRCEECTDPIQPCRVAGARTAGAAL